MGASRAPSPTNLHARRGPLLKQELLVSLLEQVSFYKECLERCKWAGISYNNRKIIPHFGAIGRMNSRFLAQQTGLQVQNIYERRGKYLIMKMKQGMINSSRQNQVEWIVPSCNECLKMSGYATDGKHYALLTSRDSSTSHNDDMLTCTKRTKENSLKHRKC